MSNRNFYLLIILALIVYIFNLQMDVMQVDAAQYAEMSWEMLSTHSYLQLHCLGQNYLDKPPLIFWLSSACFLIFGVNNAAYKLPSLLFALLAIFSTYRLAKIYYDEKTARLSAVMLATCEAVFLITNDVRTDTLLMGAVIFGIWQWAEFFEEGAWLNLLLGSLGIALALLAKGPIGLVVVGAGLMPQLILSGSWRKLMDLRLFIALIIITVLLTPMCFGLYQQFGAKGLAFYFWTQSFGRITGSSQWNNHPDTFFLLHTTAWAFLPWTMFLLFGWVSALSDLLKNKFKITTGAEIISVSGFTLVLVMLMLSKYQLPHYIFVVYPLAAIMAAKGFLQMAAWAKLRPWLTGLQLAFLFALTLTSALLQYALKGADLVSLICLLTLYPLAVYATIRAEGGIKTYHTVTRYISYRFRRFYHGVFGGRSDAQLTVVFGLDVAYKKLFFASAIIFTIFNFLWSAFYFPAILKYQPACDFGRYAKAHSVNHNFICYNTIPDFAMVFYAQQIPPQNWDKESVHTALVEKDSLLIYASASALTALNEAHIHYTIIEQRESYLVARLGLGFLNPKTRSSVCEQVYLLQATKN